MFVLAASSALLAAWLVARFPHLVPATARAVTLFILGAMAIVAVTPWAITIVGVPLGVVPAIFIVVLPFFTYLFVTAAAIMLYALRAIGPFLK